MYSDGTKDESGSVKLAIIVIENGGFESPKKIENGIRNFEYNTVIKVRLHSENPIGGALYFLDEKAAHTEHTGEYVSFETGHQYVYTCGCPTPDIMELHADHDGDGKCDVCGYVTGEHEHTTIMWFDENSHSWSYTCGCPTPPNAAQHAVGDDDRITVTGGIGLSTGTVDCAGDHRIAMALSVAAAFSKGESSIDSDDSVKKSNPAFFSDFTKVGGKRKIPKKDSIMY